MNNAIILQQAYSDDIWGDTGSANGQGCAFYDHLALTFPIHAAYARAHRMDLQVILGNVDDDLLKAMGGWAKIALIKEAARKYRHVFWIDADAVIWDMTADLRDALKDKSECIGAVRHPGFPPQLMPHLNVGVMYFRQDERLIPFLDEWLGMWPGKPPMMEQGAFNELIEKRLGVVAQLDNAYNATWKGVAESPHPIIRGYHGGMSPVDKLAGMRAELRGKR